MDSADWQAVADFRGQRTNSPWLFGRDDMPEIIKICSPKESVFWDILKRQVPSLTTCFVVAYNESIN